MQAFALDIFTLEQVGQTQVILMYLMEPQEFGVKKPLLMQGIGKEMPSPRTLEDLSYRAQLKNWKFKCLEDVHTPQKLPVVMSAYPFTTIPLGIKGE